MAARDLAHFLRTRRARIEPADAGLPASGRRRAPGLRRAEVALLAGISPDYYMRLEQGRDIRPSSSVLDALARALRFDDDERDHLYRLARAEPAPPIHAEPPPIGASVRRLLDVIDPVPAYVLNGRLDVLAWNAMAAALVIDFGELPPARRNLAWFAFCDPRARTFYVDWGTIARHAIAQLRTATGMVPDDPATRTLIGELAERSEEFRAWWTRHDVKGPSIGRKEFDHPVVGRLGLDYVCALLPGTLDHQIVTYTAPPGSPAQAALDRLAAARG
ncbi:transcriptional regulator [Microtetraspora sp. NBRC 13810]|uniref:helix-turn-helix transcriptional regulator n=1 Tax=Microtetraspora sp. NBRC 13810 TaxID=3030990 RepID=UPI00249FED1A|nr:helix-turn-helix transcriptional regulator [Microtetraspora sp. NBRC 13810]GLW08092.1 transcriptional regulator [Microtetraspora sp. NBRC 13810]